MAENHGAPVDSEDCFDELINLVIEKFPKAIFSAKALKDFGDWTGCEISYKYNNGKLEKVEKALEETEGEDYDEEEEDY